MMEKSTSNHLLLGLLFATIAGIIVFGSLQLSVQENQLLLPSATQQKEQFVSSEQPTSMLDIALLTPHTPTTIPTESRPQVVFSPTPILETQTPSSKPIVSATANPTSKSCPPPGGWYAITIQTGDSLATLASQYHTTTDALSKANCLLTESILPGTVLYIPDLPPTQMPPCGVPTGWVYYTVQSGDTLSSISFVLNISIKQLQDANCLGDSTVIRNGQQLYVPFLPPHPSPSPWVIPTYSYMTNTPLSPLPSSVPVYTLIPTLSQTPQVIHTTTPEIPPPFTPATTAWPSATIETTSPPWPSATPE